MIRILIVTFLACAMPLEADPIEMTHSLIEGLVHSNSDVKCSFRVEIHQVTLDKVVHKRKYYHGHYDDQHEYVCSGVSIFLNGRKIKIPAAAYSDLCNLQSVAPPEPLERGRWMVRIEGGCAGESYRVDLVFNDKKLLERRFAGGEDQGTKSSMFKNIEISLPPNRRHERSLIQFTDEHPSSLDQCNPAELGNKPREVQIFSRRQSHHRFELELRYGMETMMSCQTTQVERIIGSASHEANEANGTDTVNGIISSLKFLHAGALRIGSSLLSLHSHLA